MRRYTFLFAILLVTTIGFASALHAKTVGCFIAFEVPDACVSSETCKAGFNKVWFEDSADIGGTKPEWLSFPSKAETEIYYMPRNKFVNGFKADDPQTFATSFGELVVFDPNVGKTAKYNFYYNCRAQPE